MVKAGGDAAEGHALRLQLAHPGDDPLLASVFDEESAGAEVPAIRTVSAEAFAARLLHIHRIARSLLDRGPFQLGEYAGYLRHRPGVGNTQVEPFR